jgi:hypothetical protein
MEDYVTYRWLLTFLGGLALGLIVLFSTLLNKKVDERLCNEIEKNVSNSLTKFEKSLTSNTEKLQILEVGQERISGKIDTLLKRIP